MSNGYLIQGDVAIFQNNGIVGDSAWWDSPNLWEPPVVLALRDIVHPGDIAVDVGANFGGVTRHLSRLVGPKGLVLACEPSPQVLPNLVRNVRAQGLMNCWVVPAAISDSDFGRVQLFTGYGGDDSLVFDRGGGQAEVTTWTLD